jgi:hypothetical protein
VPQLPDVQSDARLAAAIDDLIDKATLAERKAVFAYKEIGMLQFECRDAAETHLESIASMSKGKEELKAEMRRRRKAARQRIDLAQNRIDLAEAVRWWITEALIGWAIRAAPKRDIASHNDFVMMSQHWIEAGIDPIRRRQIRDGYWIGDMPTDA